MRKGLQYGRGGTESLIPSLVIDDGGTQIVSTLLKFHLSQGEILDPRIRISHLVATLSIINDQSLRVHNFYIEIGLSMGN